MAFKSLLALLALMPGTLAAQRLARRIDDVRDGTVRFSYAPRPGVCGDGRETVRTGSSFTVMPSTFGRGRSDSDLCFAGPVRVTVGRRNGETVSFRIHVGGRWTTSDNVDDLGTVGAAEAARYLFDQALQANASNAEYALAGAVFADSIDLVPDLLRLVRASDDRKDLRQRAVFWISTYEDERAIRALHDLAADERLDEDTRGAAIIALGRDEIADDDVAWLRTLYTRVSSKLRDDIFLAVSRSESPEASQWLASVITDKDETVHAREQAMFWMGQGRGSTEDLVRLYARLDQPSLRSHYTFVISQRRDDRSIAKLIDIAQHDADRDVRHQALFWLGQSKDPRALALIRDLVIR